jgi:membrane peptidoglycan carboxypeptidase
MATGYGSFMTGGMKLPTHAIVQVADSSGNVLYDYRKDGPKPERALSERTVGVMNRIMAQIPEWGTARKAALERCWHSVDSSRRSRVSRSGPRPACGLDPDWAAC